MPRRPPTRTSLVTVSVLLVGFIAWSWLTFHSTALERLDAVAPPRLHPGSATAQIAAAFALLTWPGLLYTALVFVAIWAARRRLRQLAVGLVLTVGLAWASVDTLKVLIGRPRPEQALQVLTAGGYAYPSGHVAGVVATTIGVGATFVVTRQTWWARFWWTAGAVVLVIAVALDRWLLGAHYITDIVGGLLLGATASTLSLLIAGVRVPAPHDLVTELVRARTPAELDAPSRRVAVIYNPVKVVDWVVFRRQVEYELRERGWGPPLWLETTPDDPGRAMTETAVRDGVDLVLGAGGDGTIRVICSGLAGTGIPFGLIPSGTGNLLARNVGIPLDRAAALDVALDGVDKPIDLVKITVDHGPADHFAVIAGIGIDAVIMESTNSDLKRAVGSAAYFVAAAQSANHPALHTTIRVDDRPPLRRRAHLILVGNVGFLQANISLIPDARPDDGLLDVMVASPRTARDWIRLTTRVLTRREEPDSQLDRLTGRSVTITVEERDQFQLDGDTVGECGTMTADIQPGALTLRVPASVAEPGQMTARAAARSE